MSSYPPPPAYQQPAQPPAGEPPLWAPWYGIQFGAAIRRAFQKYADFSGRASRSEFWWFALAYGILIIILDILQSIAHGGAGGVIISILSVIIGLGLIVPTLAITWRRLHDTNLAGPFWFLGLIPVVGWIIVLVLVIRGSNPQGQRFDRPRA